MSTNSQAPKYYAYVKRTSCDWGTQLRAKREQLAKAEARRLFADEHRDAVIYLCEMHAATDGGSIKLPIASATVTGGRWAAV